MALKKSRVLILTQWFIPAYKAGGPVTSVFNLVEALKKDVDFWIICGNRDVGSAEDLAVQTDSWLQLNGVNVHYCSSSSYARKLVRRELQNSSWSSMYLNSLYLPTWTIYPLMVAKGLPLHKVLAPRGMLGAGALQIKSLKKKSFLKLAKSFGIFREVQWHATDATELEEIELHFGKRNKIEVIPNLPSSIPSSLEFPEGRNRNSILFLSRISRKKNLLFLLQQLVRSELPYELTVVGPSEDQAYENECRAYADDAGLKVHWKGALTPKDLGSELVNHSLMFLPTLHENYGHVILQSWGYGLPVLLSDNTPWRNLEEQGLGWDISLNSHEHWQNALQTHFSMPEKELNEWRLKCHSFVLEKLSAIQDIAAYKKLLAGEH